MTAQLVTLFCQNQQSEHTAKNAKYRLAAFARWLESEYHVTDLEAVTVQYILGYKAYLAKSGLAATSQARVLETLRSFFRWCHRAGMIDHDPAQSVQSPRAVLNREPEYLTADETRKLFDAIDGKHAARDRAVLWVLALGLRAGEVVGLNCGDVLPPADGRLGGLVVTGKRAYQRRVPLPQVAYDAIQAYITERGQVGNDAPLFTTYYSGSVRRMSKINLQLWFRDAVIAAGLDKSKAHCHAMRHGAAMRWLYQSNAPGGIYTVSRMLGHSSIQTTQRYLHVGAQGRAAMESAVLADPLTA